MARKAMIAKAMKRMRRFMHALAHGRKPKFSSRVFNVCKLCGRSRGYMRKFDMCRICFRLRARKGEIMGVKKSSW